MVIKRWVGFLALCAALAWIIPVGAMAQSAVDTLAFEPPAPDSFYVRREGGDLVIGWYPPHESVASAIGTLDLTNWYGGREPADGVNVYFSGYYRDNIDRTLRMEKRDRSTHVIGQDAEIPVQVQTTDVHGRTYRRRFDLGTNSYQPGAAVPAILTEIGLPPGEVPGVLNLGFNFHFGAGTFDTSDVTGWAASYRLDLQTFEGYHVWRGTEPYPSHMQVIAEISHEDYFRFVSLYDNVVDVPSRWRWLWEYFRGGSEPAWPRLDTSGRRYFEWVDRNAFEGITYYYTVTTYDQGYYNTRTLYNKKDSFICDEDPDAPAVPGEPVYCRDATIEYTMTMDARRDVDRVYAIPNPYRTGTSAETTPYYHNFPDNSIKFFNMPREATIKIYTVAGELVWQGVHSSPDGSDGIISWDVRNRRGQEVGSGVYVFRVENPEGSEIYGKIVVIR